jgi:hypothetical protein
VSGEKADTMKLFIGWSSKSGREIGKALRMWLLGHLPQIKPLFSPELRKYGENVGMPRAFAPGQHGEFRRRVRWSPVDHPENRRQS